MSIHDLPPELLARVWPRRRRIRPRPPACPARPRPRVDDPSPWGPIQHLTVLAEGVIEVETAGHGGIWLSAERLAQMPADERSTDGWYEQDCEAVFPLHRFIADVTFPEAGRGEAVAQHVAASVARYGTFATVAMNR